MNTIDVLLKVVSILGFTLMCFSKVRRLDINYPYFRPLYLFFLDRPHFSETEKESFSITSCGTSKISDRELDPYVYDYEVVQMHFSSDFDVMKAKYVCTI